MCLGNISRDFTVNNMEKNFFFFLNGNVYGFSVGYNTFDTSDITNIHIYLMFGIIKNIFIGLLSICTIGGLVVH